MDIHVDVTSRLQILDSRMKDLKNYILEETQDLSDEAHFHPHLNLPERVGMHHRPDQSVYKLKAQLEILKNDVSRIEFYLTDLKESLPV